MQEMFLTLKFPTEESALLHLLQNKDTNFCFSGRGEVLVPSANHFPQNQPGLVGFDMALFFYIFCFCAQVRVGVVIFSTKAEHIFYLNDYFTTEEVKDAISRQVL